MVHVGGIAAHIPSPDSHVLRVLCAFAHTDSYTSYVLHLALLQESRLCATSWLAPTWCRLVC